MLLKHLRGVALLLITLALSLSALAQKLASGPQREVFSWSLNIASVLTQEPNPPSPTQSLPQNILDLELQSVSEGRFRLSDYQGNTVILNFWATWCGPCKLETPMLVKLQKQFRAQGVRVIALSTEDPSASAKDVQNWIETYNVNYQVGWAPNEFASTLTQGRQLLPQTFIISRDRRILKRFIGFDSNMTPPLIKQVLRDAIYKREFN